MQQLEDCWAKTRMCEHSLDGKDQTLNSSEQTRPDLKRTIFVVTGQRASYRGAPNDAKGLSFVFCQMIGIEREPNVGITP